MLDTAEPDISKIINIISSLGGPSIEQTDIQWATELPAGKKLIEWLASQIDGDDISDDAVGASLGQIAFEAEEIRLLEHFSLMEPAEVAVAAVPSGYVPPSRQRSHAAYLNNEAAVLESETQVLKNRLRQTKLASQKIDQAMKQIKAQIAGTEMTISEAQERLADLSIQMDQTIAATTAHSQSLLRDLGSEDFVDPCRRAIEELSSFHAKITGASVTTLKLVSEAERALLLPPDVVQEASRLQASITKRTSAAQKSLLLRYFNDAAATLNAMDADANSLDHVLKCMACPESEISPPLDVCKEIEKAWNMDQEQLLVYRQSVLEKTKTVFETDLLPRLGELDTNILVKEDLAQEASGLIVALEEELSTIYKNRQWFDQRDPELERTSDDESLQSTLVDQLKALEHLRPIDAPPLMLFNKAGMIDELQATVQRYKDTQEKSSQWTKELPVKLNTSSATHEPLLQAIYRHSAVNSSRPFSASASVIELQNRAKMKSEALAGSIKKLQEASRIYIRLSEKLIIRGDQDLKTAESDKTRTRLKEFVDTWT
ncbi:hypothetical protein C8J56DRAFT_1160524 [Mycena floridula]|nr:hypothetical protein C8J56DRAFT_1160524 [Mycena floridula]